MWCDMSYVFEKNKNYDIFLWFIFLIYYYFYSNYMLFSRHMTIWIYIDTLHITHQFCRNLTKNVTKRIIVSMKFGPPKLILGLPCIHVKITQAQLSLVRVTRIRSMNTDVPKLRPHARNELKTTWKESTADCSIYPNGTQSECANTGLVFELEVYILFSNRN